MNAHTPGPWIARKRAVNDDWIILPQDRERAESWILAECRYQSNDAANARLIAASPELLKACEELLLYIQADNELKVVMYPQSLDYARQAIAKVKGAS